MEAADTAATVSRCCSGFRSIAFTFALARPRDIAKLHTLVS